MGRSHRLTKISTRHGGTQQRMEGQKGARLPGTKHTVYQDSEHMVRKSGTALNRPRQTHMVPNANAQKKKTRYSRPSFPSFHVILKKKQQSWTKHSTQLKKTVVVCMWYPSRSAPHIYPSVQLYTSFCTSSDVGDTSVSLHRGSDSAADTATHARTIRIAPQSCWWLWNVVV